MYLSRRFYVVAIAVILVIIAGQAWSPLFAIGRGLLVLLLLLSVADGLLLWSKRGITASRSLSLRFSNGDDNTVSLRVENDYPFALRLTVIDEIPAHFQRRDIAFPLALKPREGKNIDYRLRPVRRGIYSFGQIRVFASTLLGLLQRRFTCDHACDVKVYPSYLMLRQYELLAINNRLTEMGIKKIRRVGNNTEFEQIKDYVQGDDYRTINWRATARRHQLMVNVYQDERSQQVFSIIDKGRTMQHAFRQMTLLDYAINASLVLSYVAMHREDKAGLVTFNDQFDTFVPASKHAGHIQTLLENLYAQRTTFGESDYSALAAHLGKHVSKRSLLILYTHFIGISSMRRQLPYLIQLARRHRLLVVFFNDNEIKDYIATPPADTEDLYRHVIAEKFDYEQRLIVSELRRHGILSLLTSPDQLSIDVINKYLELKKQHL